MFVLISILFRFTPGDEVRVVMNRALDTTPLQESTDNLYHGFNGFRI